jgi:hypothetical protein
MFFSFGQSQHERVEVEVLDYERHPVGDYHDDNWVTARVRVTAGGFRGTIDAAFLSEEFVSFLTQLRSLHTSLSGIAEFVTLEGQLELRLSGDGRGHIELIGQVADQPGIGNRLHFTLHFDQSQLRASIHELERVTAAFPVRVA